MMYLQIFAENKIIALLLAQAGSSSYVTWKLQILLWRGYIFKGRLENNICKEEEINIRMLHLNMEYIYIFIKWHECREQNNRTRTHTHIDHICLAVLRMGLRASCLLGFPLSPIESDVVGQPSSPHSSFADRTKDNRTVLSSWRLYC